MNSSIISCLDSDYLLSSVARAHGFPGRNCKATCELSSCLVEVASRHGVLFPFLAHTHSSAENFAEHALSTARHHAMAHMAHLAAVRESLSIVSQKFRDFGVPFLLMKGLAVQKQFHGQILRQVGDLDLIVHPRDIKSALEALKEVSTPHSISPPRTQNAFVEVVRGIQIDLHTAPFERYISDSFDVDHLLTNSLHVLVSPECEARIPSDLDHLLILLVHGFKHQWCRLKWALDVALVIKKYDSHFLEQLLEKARIVRVYRIARIGLTFVSTLFDLQNTFGPTTLERKICEFYVRRLFELDTGGWYKTQNICAHLIGFDNYKLRLRYALARLHSLVSRVTTINSNLCR